MDKHFGPILFFSTMLIILTISLEGCLKEINTRGNIKNYPGIYCEFSSARVHPRIIYECFKYFEKEEKIENGKKEYE